MGGAGSATGVEGGEGERGEGKERERRWEDESGLRNSYYTESQTGRIYPQKVNFKDLSFDNFSQLSLYDHVHSNQRELGEWKSIDKTNNIITT